MTIKNVIKAMNKKKKIERTKNLTIAATLGSLAGAVTALFVAPKSDSINNSLNKAKKKVSEAVATGKDKVSELVKDGKVKLEAVKSDIREGKAKLQDTKEDIKDDIIEGKKNLKDTENKIKDDMKR